MSEKALATVNLNVPSLTDMASVFAEEMDGLDITFDRVRIPSGGGLAFEVPGEDPDSPDLVKELVGVIVDHHPINVYYAMAYSGGNAPPDCASDDGKVGYGTPGGDCATCRYNQWSSADDGRGKACQNKRRVYLLREGELFPVLLTLPATSLRNFGDYMAKRVLSRGRRSYDVLTRITLRKATNAGGIAYSQAQFAVAGTLDTEAAKRAMEMAQGIKAYTRAVAIQAADADYSAPEQGVTYQQTSTDDGKDLPF